MKARVGTEVLLAPAAEPADTARVGEPRDADALAEGKSVGELTAGVDHADDLVTGRDARTPRCEIALREVQVRTAHARHRDPHPHLVRTGLGHGTRHRRSGPRSIGPGRSTIQARIREGSSSGSRTRPGYDRPGRPDPVNGLDVALVTLTVASILWGVRTGFTIQVGTYAGILAGILLGVPLATETASWSSTPFGQMLLALGTALGCAAALGSLGGWLGASGLRWVRRAHLGGADGVLGGAIAGAGILAVTWLLAGALASVPRADIGPTIQGSAVIRWLDDALPPVPDVAARLGRLTDPLGLPRVFAGLERVPAPPVPGPTDAVIRAAAGAARVSTVKIEGSGCGSLRLGSGFVVGRGMVMTNAHVVAGARDLTVSDTAGNHSAAVITFDPRLDVAVLRTSGLAGPPLVLDGTDVDRGATGAVLGYPNGGALTIGGAAVGAAYDAIGRDIYGGALVTRSIVELQATVRPGNSGGPLVLADGSVGGVVFGRSVTDGSTGYAIAASTARFELDRTRPGARPVSTGPCPAD